MINCYLQKTCAKYQRGECTDSFVAECPRLRGLGELLSNALLSPEQRRPIALRPDGVDLNSYQYLGYIQRNIKQFVESGSSLYIYSPITGNGKTAWATKLMQSYLDKVWIGSSPCRALFINVPLYLMRLKENITEKNQYIAHIKKYVSDVDLVVWDDIATKSMTEYEQENLLSIINERINKGKSNIYTANVEPLCLERCIGARLASRVKGSQYVQFVGPDMRHRNK